MRKTVVALALGSALMMISCADAAKDKDPTAAQLNKQEKAITVQDLQNQRAVLQLRIQGAESARNAVEAVISQGKVDLEILNRQIEAMTPKAEGGIEKK